MIRQIMKDTFFLGLGSSPATKEDKTVGHDLLDTLKANSKACVGMAANMIGISKRIIAFEDNGKYTLMYNPEIIKCSDGFFTVEGCLSLEGTRQTKRYKTIKVQYQNEDFLTRIKTFKGFTAQIIQHEIDHCNGVVI